MLALLGLQYTSTVVDVVQLLLSVAKIVCVPKTSPETMLLFEFVGCQLKLYGAVPPVAITVAVPLDPPKQETALLVAEAANTANGWVIENV